MRRLSSHGVVADPAGRRAVRLGGAKSEVIVNATRPSKRSANDLMKTTKLQSALAPIVGVERRVGSAGAVPAGGFDFHFRESAGAFAVSSKTGWP